ncbi:MAG: hypothetical protein QOE70_4036 [Chthoniobacter sp.]|jgi:hypothetical protein|nr:hypothetical protein [Chthoniobacter sp.]
MYQNTAAEFRPELQVKVEEAMEVDDSFVADSIFPIFPVKTRAGFFKKIKRGKGQLLSKAGGSNNVNDPLVRAPGTRYREVTRTTEQHQWKCIDRGLEEPMDDVNKQEESRFYDLESSTAAWLMRNMRISREVRVAAVVQDQNVWGTHDAGDAYTEANLGTFNFAEDTKQVKRIMRKRQEAVNAMAMSLNLWDLITGSEKLRAFFFGANGGNAMVDEEMIAKKFKIKYVLIGQTSYDTTKPGKDSTDDNLQWAWADSGIWFGNIAGGPPETGGAGRTFILDELTGGELFCTESYRDESIRSDRLRVRQDDDTNVVNENSGIILKVADIA